MEDAIDIPQEPVRRVVIAQPDIDQHIAQLDSEVQHVRDFVVLHNHPTNRHDTPYWRDIAAMGIPATLKHRMMMGQGVMRQQYHPVADVMSEPDLTRFLGDIRSNVDGTVRQLPAHMDYLRSYCPTPGPVR